MKKGVVFLLLHLVLACLPYSLWKSLPLSEDWALSRPAGRSEPCFSHSPRVSASCLLEILSWLSAVMLWPFRLDTPIWTHHHFSLGHFSTSFKHGTFSHWHSILTPTLLAWKRHSLSPCCLAHILRVTVFTTSLSVLPFSSIPFFSEF